LSEHSLGSKPPDLSAFSIDELEDMREGLQEAIDILGPAACIPQEYLETMAAIANELIERTLLN